MSKHCTDYFMAGCIVGLFAGLLLGRFI